MGNERLRDFMVRLTYKLCESLVVWQVVLQNMASQELNQKNRNSHARSLCVKYG